MTQELETVVMQLSKKMEVDLKLIEAGLIKIKTTILQEQIVER